MEEEPQLGFCIYIDTLTGTSPAVRNGDGMPFVFPTRVEAEREIAANIMTRLQEFLDGKREFEDAITLEEYVVDVEVLPDGSVWDEEGNHFGAEGRALLTREGS